MSSEKKDLTRIEDLGEYLHDLNNEEESFEPPTELPEEATEEAPPFETTENFGSDEVNFGTEDSSTEFTTTEETSAFEVSEEPTFGSSEETDFTTTTDTFSVTEETTEFGESDFGANDFTSPDESTREEQATNETAAFDTDDFTTTTETVDDFPSISETTPEPEPIQESVYAKPVVEEKTYKAPETFEDLKKFAESTSFAGMGAEGNPSFSVLLKNVRYIEDVNDILSMLKELGLMSDAEEQTKARLMRGHLLVPRISEYAAIFLAHKLRRFDIDIQVGLSDEIHPPKHQEAPETGLVSKHSLYQNQSHHFHFDDPKLELAHIIVAATSNLEGHQVIRYLGVASEHKMLEGHVVEDEGNDEIPRHYTELAQKLKAHAIKAHANAVIGLNYQLTPLPSEYGLTSSKYRLSCTGNLVWVNKL